ncbi:type II secretion system protein N [Huaxiibacter chinensis]
MQNCTVTPCPKLAFLQDLGGMLLPYTLLSATLVWLAFALTTSKPEVPNLPPVASRVTAEPPELPDLFSLQDIEETFAVSRLTVTDPRLINAPLSQLPFRVTGILSSTDPLKSHAILTANKRQFMVSINDKLEGTSAQVVRIFADRIILTYQDRYEALLISPETLKNRP